MLQKWDNFKSLFAISMALSVIQLVAATNTIVNGATDWNDANSYVGKVKPAGKDVVIIPDGATVYLDLTTEKGQKSLELVNTLERIIPVAESSKLVVSVGNNDVKTFGVPFTAAVFGRGDVTNLRKGELIKKGLGELVSLYSSLITHLSLQDLHDWEFY